MPPIGKKPSAPASAPSKGPASKGPARPASKPAPAGDEHGTKNVEAALEELENEWGSAEAKTGFEKLPEGRYQAQISAAKVEHAKSSGRLQATFELTIAGGDYVNRKLWKRDGLNNEESIGWFKGGLARLGVEAPSSMREVPALLESLVGSYCEITVKHAEGDFVNTYFNKALDSNEVDTSGLEEAPTEEGGEEGGEGEEPAAEPKTWKVGDKVQADFDGDWYTGNVTKINSKTRMATVKFEDGEVHEKGFDDLEPVDEGEVQPATPEGASVTFDEKAITPPFQTRLDKIARAHDFNPDDYAEWLPLLTDVLEHCGVTGEFSKPGDAIAAAEKVKPAKK